MTNNKNHKLRLSGLGASPGTAVGPVFIVDSHSDPDSFPEWSILVAHTTNPSLVSFMLKASGIITEIGGRLCHTAIVALELGIPCVVAVENVVSLVSNGERIFLDGKTGEVIVFENEEN